MKIHPIAAELFHADGVKDMNEVKFYVHISMHH